MNSGEGVYKAIVSCAMEISRWSTGQLTEVELDHRSYQALLMHLALSYRWYSRANRDCETYKWVHNGYMDLYDSVTGLKFRVRRKSEEDKGVLDLDFEP